MSNSNKYKEMMKKIFIAGMMALSLCSCDKDNAEIDNNYSNGLELIINGRLSDYINESNINTISRLTINGSICGTDWNTLREMGLSGNLTELDMTNATIENDTENDFWNANEIPEKAFNDCKKLTSIKLPKTVRVIGAEAFVGCSKLKYIEFPESIDSIADEAFRKVPLEGVLNFPVSMRVIGKQAFAYTNIEEVIINSDIESPSYEKVYAVGGNSVFAKCKQLKKVTVSEGCTKLEIGFDGCKSLTEMSLPSTLETLGRNSRKTHNYIFAYCSSLTSISLPEKLWFIGYEAFGHSSLQSINIPDRVQYIWTYAFVDCKNLTKVKLPKQLRQIEQGAFEGCDKLTQIFIPDYVTKIGYKAFADCETIIVNSWGKSIESIDKEAFSNCKNISKINLPGTLIELGSSAFSGCSGLQEVNSLGEISELKAMTFKDCISLREINLSNTLEVIGSSCFFHCPQLATLTLPQTINIIDDYAFSYCGIKELTVQWQDPIVINKNVFDGINLSKSTLCVPVGSRTQYENSLGWNNFGNIIEQ